MPDACPPVRDRFRWGRVLGWGLIVALVAAACWSGWREYDYRAAVREVRAAGFRFDESPTPFAAIRADWYAAFRLATWLDHRRDLTLPTGTDLAPLRPLLLRLDPTGLTVYQSRNVDALRGLTRLRTLILSGTDVKDLAPLAGLMQLQDLDLTDTGVADLTPLAGLTQLRGLVLSVTGVTNLGPLAGLSRLQGLHLSGCLGVADLTPLAGLTQLRSIRLSGTGVADLTPLAGLTRLQGLSVGEGVKDLAPLLGLTQLEFLDLPRSAGPSPEAVDAFQKSHPQTTVSRP
ncbi:MAG: hypothetical protein K8R23_09775 [Chthoniobacter sp.]|nr:hypothetical protein [Chthoniobacter sp.]